MTGSCVARKNDKRDRLIDAAADLFWTRGFDATPLADIAKEANVPLGNVYYYFKTKIDLARSVADLFVDQSEILIATLNDESDDPAVKLQKFIDVLAGSNKARTERGCPIAKAFADFKRHDQIAALRAAEALKILVRWAQESLTEAGDPDPRRTARRIISDWQGAIVLAHAFEDQTHLDETIAKLRDTIRQSPASPRDAN